MSIKSRPLGYFVAGLCLRECKNRGEKCNDCFGFSNYSGKPIKKNTNINKDNAGPTGNGVVDIGGNPQRLSSYQKNSFYGQAKQLKGEIKEALCTKDECKNPTDRNINKMRRGEEAVKKKIEKFKKCMQIINASPKEYNVEKLRR